jgi:hypothetical protein
LRSGRSRKRPGPPAHHGGRRAFRRFADWRAVRVLKSEWIIEASNSSASAIRDDLVKYIDGNDGLLVVTMTGEAAWQKLEGTSDQYLLGKRAA